MQKRSKYAWTDSWQDNHYIDGKTRKWINMQTE